MPMPDAAPIHALRVKLKSNATSTGQMVSAGHKRGRLPKSNRAAATFAHSIISPANVMYMPNVLRGR
jgi:hypothetical protein